MWEDEWRRYHVRTAMEVMESEFRASYVAAFTRHWLEGAPACKVAAELKMSKELVYKATSLVRERLQEQIREQVEAEG